MRPFPADAGEVHDRAPAAPAHVRRDFLHEYGAADQVHVQCLPPFPARRCNTVVQVGAGDIHQAIDAAPLIERLLYDRIYLRVIGDVGRDELQRVSRFLFQFTAAGFIDIAHRYLCAGPDEFMGDLSAYHGCAAGNDRNLVFEIYHNAFTSSAMIFMPSRTTSSFIEYVMRIHSCLCCQGSSSRPGKKYWPGMTSTPRCFRRWYSS